MKSVPLTRARHARNFAIALHQQGIAVDGYLDRFHLPGDLLDSTSGEAVLSALGMLDFAEYSALRTGISDLGYWAGTVPIGGYGEFGAQVVGSATLQLAIQTFCNKVRGECSQADYYLIHGDSKASFCHGPVSDAALLQHELYAATIMVQVVRLALGPDWKPVRLRLQTVNESALKDNEFFRSTNIEFGAPVTAVELPLRGLASRLRFADDIACDMDGSSRGRISDRFLPADPIVALRELISVQIRQSKQPSLELTAEMAGVSARTLQRFLRKKTTSYSRLIDQARFDLAAPMLEDNSITISEISLEVGYSNVAHFSRAFTRIAGMSPTTYRGTLDR